MLKKAYTFTLPIELVDSIKRLAQKEKRPLSNQIEFMLEKELELVIRSISASVMADELNEIMTATLSGLEEDLADKEEDEAWSYL